MIGEELMNGRESNVDPFDGFVSGSSLSIPYQNQVTAIHTCLYRNRNIVDHTHYVSQPIHHSSHHLSLVSA